jgi:hypothetical protein
MPPKSAIGSPDLRRRFLTNPAIRHADFARTFEIFNAKYGHAGISKLLEAACSRG